MTTKVYYYDGEEINATKFKKLFFEATEWIGMEEVTAYWNRGQKNTADGEDARGCWPMEFELVFEAD